MTVVPWTRSSRPWIGTAIVCPVWWWRSPRANRSRCEPRRGRSHDDRKRRPDLATDGAEGTRHGRGIALAGGDDAAVAGGGRREHGRAAPADGLLLRPQ